MKKLVTIFLAAVFLLVTFVPVSAADWNLYGSARVTTFWTDFDKDGPWDDADTTQLTHDLQGNARFGGNVSHENVKGGFEYGTGVNVRLLYGIVDLGFGEFLVGQHYVPLAAGSFLSNQAYGPDNNMLQFVAYTGAGGSGRAPMGQLSVNGLKIALVKPFTASYTSTVDGLAKLIEDEEIDEDTAAPFLPFGKLFESKKASTGEPEILLPQIQASYDLKMDGAAMNFGGGFQTYDLLKGEGDTLTSWMAAFNSKLTMMNPMYINFGGFYGQNVGNMGQAGEMSPDGKKGFTTGNADVDPVTGEVEDTITYGALIALGAKLDKIGFEAGVGYRESDNDNWEEKQKMMAYYLQATIPLSADGRAFIVPEVGYYDWDLGDDADYNQAYAGLKWQVNF